MLRKPVLIIFGLSAAICLAAPATAADLGGYGCQHIKLICSGFEPNWRFTLNTATLKFTDPENTNGGVPPIVISACASPLPGNKIGITAGAPLNLSATVSPQSCGEPSGQTRPYSIAISYTQGAAGGTPRPVSGTGCCHK